MKLPRIISPTALLDTIYTMHDGKKRPDPDPPRRRADTVSRSDITYLDACEKKVADILAFRTKDELSATLRQAFIAWRELSSIRAEKERSDIVLSAYLQQGKIRDYIEKVDCFTQRIDAIDDTDKMRLMCYSNYLYYLQHFIEDLKEKLAKKENESVTSLQDKDADTVAWFIHDECRSVSCLRDIPKAHEALKRLLGNLDPGKPWTAKQLQDKATVTLCMDLLSIDASEEDIAELLRIKENITERIDSMRKNIDCSKVLYEALTGCFTDEWFSHVNPEHEECRINDLSGEELKALYREKIQEFRDRIQGLDI